MGGTTQQLIGSRTPCMIHTRPILVRFVVDWQPSPGWASPRLSRFTPGPCALHNDIGRTNGPTEPQLRERYVEDGLVDDGHDDDGLADGDASR